MSDYLGNFFSKSQCEFFQGISAHQCLLAMIVNGKSV